MNAAVFDTDVVSMLFRGDSRAAKFGGYLSGRLLGMSFMTFAELERWSLERKWGVARKTDFAHFITKYAVLPVSRELCAQWAIVTFSAPRIDQTPLITNNDADYVMVEGLTVLSA